MMGTALTHLEAFWIEMLHQRVRELRLYDDLYFFRAPFRKDIFVMTFDACLPSLEPIEWLLL